MTLSRQPTTRDGRGWAARVAVHLQRLGWALLGGAMALLVLISVGAAVAGGRTIVIGGTSMDGTLPRGSLAVVVPVSRDESLVGQPITAHLPNGAILTHRVVREVRVDGVDYLETKGDAVASPDPALIPRSAVMGRVAAAVPLLGFVAVELQRPAGWLLLIGLLAMMYAGGTLLADATATTRAPGANAQGASRA